MKSVRIVLAVVALLALPFGSVAAQNRSKPKVRAASEVAGECKDQQAATLSRANEAGHDPYGLDKKCSDPVPPPPPPSSGPPTGVHEARGIVYEDIDGNGSRDMFAGEMGLQGWTVQLYWDGQLVASATTDADGMYLFPNLGNSDKQWWVCVSPQAGYVRTQPLTGNACSGDGTVHNLNSPFPTRLETNFGEMIQ